MHTSADSLLDRLRVLASVRPVPGRYVVAFSGGRDSSVLLHALVSTRKRDAVPVVAAHVNHGLQSAADDWQSHCESQAARLGVPIECRRAVISADARGGPEAAARRARYAALQSMMRPGDWLLLAHHEDDQAETLLLNLMRGSGVAGLAGIGEFQAFGAGYRVRPLLGISGATLAHYAQSWCLHWIRDPTNRELDFDRNFLRHRVMPLLVSRWPAAVSSMARSAGLAGSAAVLLDDLAAVDLKAAGRAERLSIAAIVRLSTDRQRNLLRFAVRRIDLPPLPSAQLERILAEVLTARADAAPLVCWRNAEARRYRGHLYLLTTAPGEPDSSATLLTTTAPVTLPPGNGALSLTDEGKPGGIDRRVADCGLRIRYRVGGETIRPQGHDCTHKLKKLLQQHGIVPWMRPRIPLLYAGDSLVAVADLWIDAQYFRADGLRVRWERSPALH